MSSGVNQVLPGVGELINEVQVEGTFPDGTKLVRSWRETHNYVIGKIHFQANCLREKTKSWLNLTKHFGSPSWVNSVKLR